MSKAKKKDKTMDVVIQGTNKKVGVMLNGEQCFPGDKVTVGLLTGKSLIARGRAIPASEAKNSAKDTGKASAKADK